MRKRIFFGGMAALMLIFALVITGCDDSASMHSIANPDVKANAVTGGVKLSWNPITEASSYQIWRSEKDKPAALLATIYNTTTAVANLTEDGVLQYFDLAKDGNELKSNTEYTYIVYSVPVATGAKDLGKWEKKITTGNIPLKGSEADEPALSDPVINFGDKSVTITVTPPASGNIPNVYQIVFSKNNSSISKTIWQDTSAPIVWTEYANEKASSNTLPYSLYSLLNSIEGTYTVKVTSGIDNNDNYYERTIVEKEKKVDPLFSGSISGYDSDLVYTTSVINGNTATGFSAYLSLSNFDPKPGVAYTVERATVDNFGNPGAYTSVSLTQKVTNTDYTNSYPPVTLDRDVLGNFSAMQVYDRSLPLEKKTYRYRIKAVKDGITDYVGSYSNQKWISVTIDDPYNSLNLGLSVGTKITNDTIDTFKITPSYINYRGILQTGDQVVLYWIRGNSNAYSNGYSAANSISFSKTEIEATAPAAKDLIVTSPAYNNGYLFVQAWLERADGEKSQIVISGNVDYYTNYDNADNTVYSLSDYYY
jgi:hypothetical protein